MGGIVVEVCYNIYIYINYIYIYNILSGHINGNSQVAYDGI